MNTGNKISFTIVVCTVVLAVVTLATSFLKIQTASSVVALPTTQAILQPTLDPTIESISEDAFVQWEYLSLSYSQGETYEADAPRYEIVLVNEPYNSIFEETLYKGCSESGSDLLTCVGRNFQGLEYFLNVLGKDNWEVINFDNTSDQYTYKVDLLFKRPIH